MTPFRVVVADPPWSFADSLPGPKRGASKHYDTMSVDEIAGFELPPIADDAWLFLWRVASMTVEALWVARAWGFTPKSEIVWVKTLDDDPADTMYPIVAASRESGGIVDVGTVAYKAAERARRLRIGMGRSVRNAHESCLVCKRGRPERRHADVPSVIFAKRRAHSEKPERFFTAVERLSDGPYLELFARRARPGWTTLGDELPQAAE